MELFKSMTGIDLVHVPYKGSAPMVNDMLGGHIDIAFDNTPNVLPQVNGEKLRALGVSSKTRSALAANVPTVSEAGVPGYEVTVWFGIVGPPGMRPEIVQKLNAEMNAIFKTDDVKRRFVRPGRRTRRRPAGAVRRSHSRRDPEMGQGGQGREYPARMIAGCRVGKAQRAHRSDDGLG